MALHSCGDALPAGFPPFGELEQVMVVNGLGWGLLGLGMSEPAEGLLWRSRTPVRRDLAESAVPSAKGSPHTTV